MPSIEHASYTDWEKAYGDVYEALPNKPPVVCPNCGHDSLRIAFVANERDHIGSSMFWCDYCHFGIHISRTWVPDGVSFYVRGTPWSELSKFIPEYNIVYPPVADEPPESDGD